MVFGDLRGSTWSGACMTDCSDYHSRHQANSLTTLVALRPHKVRDGRSIPDLGSFTSVHRALCCLFRPDTDGTRVSKCGQLSQQTRRLDPMLFQCWSSAVGGGPILKQHWVKCSRLLGSTQVSVYTHPSATIIFSPADQGTFSKTAGQSQAYYNTWNWKQGHMTSTICTFYHAQEQCLGWAVYNSVAHHNFDSELKDPAYLPDLLYGEPNVLPVQIWNAQTILKIT